MNPEYEAAFYELYQKSNGVPLANLLRQIMPICEDASGLIPIHVAYQLAQLLDPTVRSSRFGKPPTRKAMRMKIAPLTEVEYKRIKRNGLICGEVLMRVESGQSVSDASAEVAEKFKLSDRQVTEIWSTARKAMPMLQIPIGAERKIRRRHPVK